MSLRLLVRRLVGEGRDSLEARKGLLERDRARLGLFSCAEGVGARVVVGLGVEAGVEIGVEVGVSMGISSSMVERLFGAFRGEPVMVGEGSATLPLRATVGSDQGELEIRGSDFLFWVAGNLWSAVRIASSSFFSVRGFEICAVYSGNSSDSSSPSACAFAIALRCAAIVCGNARRITGAFCTPSRIESLNISSTS